MATKIKIKWLHHHPGFAYFPGNVCELSIKIANELIIQGYAEPYNPEPVSEPVPDLPEDFPGRDALIAYGVSTLAEARKIKDFTEIRGIGKSTNKYIHEYFKNHEK